MTVVPITAMVSHRLPAGLVQAAGEFFLEIRGTHQTDSARPTEAVAGVETDVLAAASPWPASSSVGAPSVGHPPPGSPHTGNVPLQAVTGATLPDSDLSEIQRRLAATGAMGIECRPLPGHAGRFSATCRVGVDAEGSLFRVLQADGSDPCSASRALLDVVQLWRERATRQSVGLPTDVQVSP